MSSLIFYAANQLAQTNLSSKQLPEKIRFAHATHVCARLSASQNFCARRQRTKLFYCCLDKSTIYSLQRAPPEFIFIYLFRQAVAERSEGVGELAVWHTRGPFSAAKVAANTKQNARRRKSEGTERANKLIRVRESRWTHAWWLCKGNSFALKEIHPSSEWKHTAARCLPDHLIFPNGPKKKDEEKWRATLSLPLALNEINWCAGPTEKNIISHPVECHNNWPHFLR